jgi:hypothetical protein
VPVRFTPPERRSVADDPNQRGGADRQRVSLEQEHEVRYWTKELGVSEQQLREAVRAVGPMVDDVRRRLGLVSGR